MNDTIKKILKPFQKFAQFYSRLGMIIRFIMFAFMAAPVALLFFGVWSLLGEWMSEGNFFRWIIAVICSMGPFLLFLIGLSNLSTMDLRTSDEIKKDEDKSK